MLTLDRWTTAGALEPPSLRTWLAALPERDLLRVSEPVDLDYYPTALVLELERQGRSPVVWLDAPTGFRGPVITNLFGCRDRIAAMVGAPPGGFNAVWSRAQGQPRARGLHSPPGSGLSQSHRFRQ